MITLEIWVKDLILFLFMGKVVGEGVGGWGVDWKMIESNRILFWFEYFVQVDRWEGMASDRLTRVHSLRERLDETLTANRNEILALLSRIEAKGKGILQHHQVIAEFEEIPEENRQKLTDGAFGEVLRSTQVNKYILEYNIIIIMICVNLFLNFIVCI